MATTGDASGQEKNTGNKRNKFMAKVMFGGGVSNIQGSIAGNTFTRTKAGPAARNRVKPNNPATPAQMEQRERITRLSKGWQGLTDDQRKAWDENAKQVKRKGVCGNNIEMTGHQLYVRANSMREENGDTATASTPPGAGTFAESFFGTNTNTLADISDSAIRVPLGSGAQADDRVAIWATGARSAGKAAYKSSLKKTFVAALSADDITNGYCELYTGWVSKFGAMTGTAGKKIVFSCRQYNDGAYSNPIILECIITE
jgi:hypothetical protein